MGYEKMGDDKLLQEKLHEAEHFKKLAILGVTFTTIAIVASVISVPMVYNYVQTVHTMLENEMEFCKVCFLVLFLIVHWKIV